MIYASTMFSRTHILLKVMVHDRSHRVILTLLKVHQRILGPSNGSPFIIHRPDIARKSINRTQGVYLTLACVAGSSRGKKIKTAIKVSSNGARKLHR